MSAAFMTKDDTIAGEHGGVVSQAERQREIEERLVGIRAARDEMFAAQDARRDAQAARIVAQRNIDAALAGLRAGR